MKRFEPFVVSYPKIVYWKKKLKASERLKIINPGDFPLNNILEGLGIKSSSLADSFGITNKNEIEQRQGIIRFFIENPMLIKLIDDVIDYNMPSGEQDFLNFNDPQRTHNPYWQSINELIKKFDATGKLPGRIENFISLLRNSVVLEASEKKMSDFIADKLLNVAIIEGTIDFRPMREGVEKKKKKKYEKPKTILEATDSQINGHQMYSYALNAARKRKYPRWTSIKTNPLNWLGIGLLRQCWTNIQNVVSKNMAYLDTVIDDLSPALKEDVANAVINEFQSIETPIDQLLETTIKVYFSYSKDGLLVQIYGIDPVKFEVYQEFSFVNYKGYDKNRIKHILKNQDKYKRVIGEHLKSVARDKLRVKITEKKPNFFEAQLAVRSPSTDAEHKWFALQNLYTGAVCRKTFNAVIRHRNYVKNNLYELQQIAELATILKKKAKKLKTSICFPEILDEKQHVVAFKEVFPIHLLPQLNGKIPVPIRELPEINGQTIGLTGAHGGGKTVTALTVTDNIYLAQSGLAVFGKNFRLNVKKMLGVVFIERGDGSTCEMLLQKIKNILKAVKYVKGNEAVLIIDELGSATQEIDGFELGRDVLNTLASKKISTLFSTQITKLAEMAEENEKAQCFKFNREHEITPGIGNGGMKELRKEIGLNRLLNQN